MSLIFATSSTWEFILAGGFFMILLGICSLTAVTVIFLKLITLKRDRVLPRNLEDEVERFDKNLDVGKVKMLEKAFSQGDNTLARLCSIAVTHSDRPQIEVKERVQSSAREEIVQMNSGLAILEVITTIAPLLGLLGTASGLVKVFGDLTSREVIQSGIATALSTTVVGIAIAVPAVIAHSYFSRRIETFAVRLEVLLSRVVSACDQRSQ